MYEDVIYAIWYFWGIDFWGVQMACGYVVNYDYDYADSDYAVVTDSATVWLIYRGSSFSLF